MPRPRQRALMMVGVGCAGALAVGSISALATPQPDQVPPPPTASVAADDRGGTRPTIDDPFVVQGHKVPICHRTGSAKNPYVVITVDVAAIAAREPGGHHSHDQVGSGPDGDIIPPVSGHTVGKNWAGQWQPGATPDPATCAAP
jgi:ABC-type sugar transport system substrate-binding protein